MPTSLIDQLNTYSVPGGRYTYYPTHVNWKNNINYFQWWDSIKKDYDHSQGIDLYIHIPFCNSICTFCGCNIRVTKSYQDIIPYIDGLKKEWNFYQKLLGNNININTIYIGGGTPNFLNAQDLDQLIAYFTGMNSSQKTQISIELDPRYITREQLIVLKNHNVHTLSFGIQDLDSKVLTNVNREQQVGPILDVIQMAHEMEFPHLNIDLIYGLTHQTTKTFEETFKLLKSCQVNSFAIYPFAKVPWQNNSQKAFGEYKDFSRIEMNELFAFADNKLKEMHFEHIGMGHFAKSDSSLLNSFKNKKIKRNIMGFTEKKSNMLIGLGVSAFSSSPSGHIQNEKVLEPYLLTIQKEIAPIFKSHTITTEELYLAALFEKIICQNTFTKADRVKVKPEQEENFAIYLSRNFLEQKGDQYIITESGRYFLKNICQCWG